jgi:hypothetical protein
MATESLTATSGPPFPLKEPTTASWREQALSRVGEQRFLLSLMNQGTAPAEAVQTINDHLDTAAQAAQGGLSLWPRGILSSVGGASVERVTSHLDAVETELLRLAPEDYLLGQLPCLQAHVGLHLPEADPRRVSVEGIARRDPAKKLTDSDREAVVAAVRAASSESRWKITRLRSFRNLLFMAAVVLVLAAIGIALLGWKNPSAVPVCFSPEDNVVCATSTEDTGAGAGERGAAAGEPTQDQVKADDAMRRAATGWDITVVELVGLISAAVAAAASLRSIRGTSTPYSLPVALAVLKLPTGALTALLGLLLMRGEFIPGLSALDSSGQIIAWAIIFGYAQQLLTGFIDRQAQDVLRLAGGTDEQPPPPHSTAGRRGGAPH